MKKRTDGVSAAKRWREALLPGLLGLAMLGAAALFPFGTAMAFEEISKTWLGGVAIDGYDSTAYWQGSPREGAKSYAFSWKGAEWRFASAAERDAFAADPGRYAPSYGGHCANAMSLGEIIDGDPQIWRIFDGKLYLFYAESGRDRWDAGPLSELIAAADANWTKLTAK